MPTDLSPRLLQPEADELNRLLQLDVDTGLPKEEPAF